MATATVSYNPAISGGATAADLDGDGLVVDGDTLDNALIVGVAGGQTIVGGTASGDGLTISTTSNATKGTLTFGSSTGFTFNEATGLVAIGGTAIAATVFTVKGNGASVNLIMARTTSSAGSGSIYASATGFGGGDVSMQAYGSTTAGTFLGVSLNTAPATFQCNSNTGAMLIGTGSTQDLVLGTNNTRRGAFTSAGSFVLGAAAIATTATDGFLYIAAGAGPPTGVPTAHTGRVPLYWDTTNKKLHVYDGAWLGGTVPGVFV